MKFEPTFIKDLFVINPEPFEDKRGWFTRIYCKEEFEKIGYQREWVQINHSFTLRKGAIRGMHFQSPPHSETKLVRCIAGSIYDVVLDLRSGSSTFLKWFGIDISADNKKMVLIPEGCAHGFQALSDNCELIYHHSDFYSPGSEGGVRFNDPIAGIKWPLNITDISDKDNNYPYLNQNFRGL